MDWPVCEYDWFAGFATHLDKHGELQQCELDGLHVSGEARPFREAGQHHFGPDLVGGDQRGGSPQECRGIVDVRFRHAGNARGRQRNAP